MADEKWQQIRTIFDDALSRDPESRAQFVEEICGEDEALLDEVKSLLSSFESAESFLEMPAIAQVADVIKPETKILEKGTRLARYEIIRRIGAGGMGEVYLARDEKLGRQVAVKILNEQFNRHESNLKRFIREAQAASALNHPNILIVHEVGESDKTHYIVSEFIEGKTLRERLNESSPPSLAKVLDIAIQTANALSAAHEANLIHRDIKPENIMIRPDGFVKVLDFGLAKLIEQKNKSFLNSEESTGKKNETAEGVILGTINYMSPEQTRGKDIDARTDVWSMGVVLYEMLTGKTPFAGETTSDTIGAILRENPAPLAETVPGIPEKLERIVDKALRKDREERYHLVKDLLIDLKDLKRELDFGEILGRSTAPSTSDKTTIMTAAQTVSSAGYIFGEIKRRKLRVVGVLAILIVSAIGLSYWYFSKRAVSTDVPRIGSIAVIPFVNDSGNADIEYIADGMTETLIGNLSQLPNLNVTARSTVSPYKGKPANPQTIGKELNVQVVVYGRIVQRGEQLMLNLNAVAMLDARAEFGAWTAQYDLELSDLISLQRAIAHHVAALLRNDKLSKTDEQKIAKTYTESSEAYQLYLRGNFHAEKRTEKEIRKGIEYLEQAIAIDPDYALAYVGLANAYHSLPVYTKVEWSEVMPKVTEATFKALSLDENLAEAHAILVLIMTNEGDDAGAEREYQRAIDLNPNSAMTYHFYSDLLRIQGKLNEAVDTQRRALELEPLSVVINQGYGNKLYFACKYDEAIAQFKKTIELDANFPSAHYGLALVYWARGDYPEAVEEHAKYHELNGEPNKAALLRESFAKGGWQGFLRTITDESQQIDLSSDDLTAYYAASGEKDKAFALLNERFERRIRPGNLVDPRLDSLHDDPRFMELLKRVE